MLLFSLLQVVAIHRYPSDPKHRTQIGIAGTAQGDVFDVIEITLADDEHKVKAVLDPELNKLVQTCQVKHVYYLEFQR